MLITITSSKESQVIDGLSYSLSLIALNVHCSFYLAVTVIKLIIFIFKKQQEKQMNNPFQITNDSFLSVSAVYSSNPKKNNQNLSVYTQSKSKQSINQPKSPQIQTFLKNKKSQYESLRNTIGSPRNIKAEILFPNSPNYSTKYRTSTNSNTNNNYEPQDTTVCRDIAVSKRLSDGSTGEENSPSFDKIMAKLDKTQKLMNQLKKLNQDKIVGKLRSTTIYDKNDKKKINSFGENNTIFQKFDKLVKNKEKEKEKQKEKEKEKDKNPEEINFKKMKNDYYTPKTNKPSYQYKVENRYTPKLRQTLPCSDNPGIQIHKVQRQINAQVSPLKSPTQAPIKSVKDFSYYDEGYKSPLGSLRQMKQVSIPNKETNISKEQKKIKDIRQISQTKGIKNNSSYFSKKLNIYDFRLGKALGEGKFGVVYPALHKQSHTLYALKKIPKSIVKSNLMIDQLTTEIKVQSFCNHENILKIYSFFQDQENIYLVLEYMEQGTLFHQLKKKKTLAQPQVAIKIKEIARAIKYLHDNGLAHRDIKPQNIVMTNGVGKLCDFGWAAICNERRKTYCGTFDYAAPEILEGNQYDMSVDLWCLGILAYELLVGKAPFYHISRKQTMKKILNVQQSSLEFPSNISKTAISFIENLVRKKPEERMTTQQILKHPFLSDSDDGSA